MGIEGLTGREPVGAVLTVGHKSSKGNPEHTDRFYLVMPQEVDGVRQQHGAYKAFNEAAPERRVAIRGNLVHSKPEQCFEHGLAAQVLPGLPQHPQKRPACSGDGRRAERWDGTKMQVIDCPNEKCQFRQAQGDKPVPCKPSMRLLFRIRWADGSPLPPMLVKFTSHAWNTTANVLGFFEHIETQAENLGLRDFSLYGFPFQLTLTKKKRKAPDGSVGRAFPIVQITPEQDVIEFLLQQQQKLQTLGAERRVVALLDDEQHNPVERLRDAMTVEPGIISVPADVEAE